MIPDEPVRGTFVYLDHPGLLALATAELRTADGKVAALATGSTMILPDRPWRTVTAPIDDAPTTEER